MTPREPAEPEHEIDLGDHLSVDDRIAIAIALDHRRITAILRELRDQLSRKNPLDPVNPSAILDDLAWALDHADADGVVPESKRR